MIAFLNRFRIPTLLGLSLLMIGIITGVYLVIKDQNYYIKASPALTPQNLTITNTSNLQVTISWQSSVETSSFITYGVNLSDGQIALDDRDISTPRLRTTHHITLKNLLPKTTYQYKITSGKYNSDVLKFTTPSPASAQNGFSPVIGSVLNNNSPLDDALVYLSISGALPQSSIVKLGNFVIPLSFIRKADLSDTAFLEEGAIAKITVISGKGESSALFKLAASSKPLPPLHLGQNIDLTMLDLKTIIASQSGQALIKLDLNNDGLTNAADYAIVVKNLGKNPKEKKADLNSDGIVDQKDLELISKQLVRE